MYSPAIARKCTDDAPRAPLSEYGRALADLEDKVLARSGAVLRLGRVLNAADPLLTRWRNGLKEGVPVSPFAEGRCAPLTVETAANALFDVLGAAPAVYQVSGPDEVPYLEIAQRLCAAMGLPPGRVVASSVTPSALGLDDWPRHVSLAPTPGHPERSHTDVRRGGGCRDQTSSCLRPLSHSADGVFLREEAPVCSRLDCGEITASVVFGAPERGLWVLD